MMKPFKTCSIVVDRVVLEGEGNSRVPGGPIKTRVTEKACNLAVIWNKYLNLFDIQQNPVMDGETCLMSERQLKASTCSFDRRVR